MQVRRSDINGEFELHRGRILCVTSNFPRWAGDSTTPFILHLAQSLQKLGWKIDILAPHARGCSLSEMLGGIHVYRFRYLWPAALQTVCYQGGALVNLRKSRLNYLKLPALMACEWLAVYKQLVSGKYDLLHSHWLLPQGFIGAAAAVKLDIPNIVSVHGSDVFSLRGSFLNIFKRYALKHSEAVTVNSSATWKAVTDIKPDVEAMSIIPMGVSEHAFMSYPSPVELRKKYRLGTGPILLFVGRVVKEKGIEDLIRSVDILKHKLPGVSLLIVGEGQDRPAFEVMTRTSGLSDRVIFCGWISPDLVPSYLSACDIFVGPSWIEAQGLAFIEAMLMRIPVIATRVGGIVDIVTHEETGLLVDKRAPNEIAAAVERLVKEPMLSDLLRERAYTLAKNKFSMKATAAAFSQLYETVIERNKK